MHVRTISVSPENGCGTARIYYSRVRGKSCDVSASAQDAVLSCKFIVSRVPRARVRCVTLSIKRVSYLFVLVDRLYLKLGSKVFKVS